MVAQHATVQHEDGGDELAVGTDCLFIDPCSAGERGRVRRVLAARGQEYRQEAGSDTFMSIIWGRSTTGVCAQSTQGTRHQLPYAMLMNVFAGYKRRRGDGQVI